MSTAPAPAPPAPAPVRVRSVRAVLLRWAASSRRPLPWRGERDPYRVLVSEVMLQQTQAARVVPCYERFLERFPTVEALAAAAPDEVLRSWGDLGYPRRAMYLWRAAQTISRSGRFPATVDELEALGGVGPYTARAVVSFAFGGDEAVVDANVRRILTRMDPGCREDVQSFADRLLPPGRSAEWNQALMDLGASVCRPRAPRCGECPLRRWCAAAHGAWETPVRERPGRPFRTTNRYARGRVLAELRRHRGGVSVQRLPTLTGLEARRVEAAVDGLERDGLVHRHRRRVRLGPGPEGP